MTALRIIDSHLEFADVGSKTHAQIEGHIQGIDNYAFPAADGGANKILKTDGAGVLSWIDRFTCSDLSTCSLNDIGTRPHSHLTGIGANDHHVESHSIVSHNDTLATGAQLDTLTDNSIADALHRHSELVASDGSPDPALSIDATGRVGIGTVSPGHALEIQTSVATLFRAVRTTAGAGVVRFNVQSGYSIILEMGDVADKDIQRIQSDNSDNSLSFWTNNVRQLHIDSSGNVGIGTASPATSAQVDITSTSGALLLSRMTTVQKNALTPINGMVLYDSTLNKFQGRENGAWVNLI